MPAPDALEPLALVDEVRADAGIGDRAGVDLGFVAAGGELRLAPTLFFRAQFLGIVPVSGEAAPGGGGELALRAVPFPAWPVRPMASATAGILLFPGAPFLPGGDVYDFRLSVGVGAEVDLGPQGFLTLDAHSAHISNGQGLGAFNPAIDTWGVGLGGGWRFAAQVPSGETAAIGPEEPGGTTAVVVDAGVGRADEALLIPGRLRVSQRLTPGVVAVGELEGGALDALPFGEGGLALVGSAGPFTGGGYAGYRNFAGIDVLVVSAQPEVALAPEFGLVATVQHEATAYFGETTRISLGGRFGPLPRLLLHLGAVEELPAANADFAMPEPYGGLEWQLPTGEGWQASVYAEHRVDGVDAAGLRLGWGLAPTLRDGVRGVGWQRQR